MGKFTVSHEINCNAETFWQRFLDNDFNERLHREGTGDHAYDIRSRHETDTEVTCVAIGRAVGEMPGPLAKLQGPNQHFVEEGHFSKAEQIWRWKRIPSSMADKIRDEGTMRVESIGPDKVRRVIEVQYEAKVFGVGGLLESVTEKKYREAADASAEFINRSLA